MSEKSLLVRVLQTYCNHITAGQRLERMLAKAADGKRKPRTAPLPQTSKRLSADEVDQIKTAWAATRNTAKISRQLGIHEQTVRKYLHEAGITTAARIRTERDNARMIELYMEGRSIRDVATKTGWSKDTVWNVLREHRQGEVSGD